MTPPRRKRSWLALSAILLVSLGAAQDGAEIGVDFAAEVRPILSDKCFACHGPDAAQREAGLRLDMPAERPGREPAIVPGSRASSLLWDRITDGDDPMPPLDSHKALSSDEVEVLGRWIDQGAGYAQHWSYGPIVAGDPPEDASGWSRTPVDRFLAQGFGRHDLSPAADARPSELLRRVHLDLTGLPPAPEQVRAFGADPSGGALEAQVEQLLASPHFGERWASWWLDLVRYADSVGFHGDQAKPAWPYRDWVVEALNAGMPFDEFSTLQLAGDLVAARSSEDRRRNLVASSYNRLSPETGEFGAQRKEYSAIYAADRVANFGEVWLGSSVGCARCHDHKYDPFTARDFYSLAAVFADIDQPIVSNRGRNTNWLPYAFVPQDAGQAEQVRAVEARYTEFLARRPNAGPYEAWGVSYTRRPKPDLDGEEAAFEEILRERNALSATVPVVSVTRALAEVPETRVLRRGNWMDEGGEVVTAGPPGFLGGQRPEGEPFDRLALAAWLFDGSHPLTARVVVNRLWAEFFGRGLSSNTLDLGGQGSPPSHRELLDWLSIDLQRSGWDLRHTMRQIVLSRAYAQSARQDPASVARDPSNRWFARQWPKRLSAETIRDQALAVSGLLDPAAGGPSSFPYQPPGHWEALNFPKRKYRASSGRALYRRSLYTWIQRTFPHPAMTVFDAPNRESCTSGRNESNTPLQSLTLLNEPLFVEAARKLAERVMAERADRGQRIERMFDLVLLRPPSPAETAVLERVLAEHRASFAARPADAAALLEVGDSPVATDLDAVDLAAFASLARTLFNLHETVTRP